MTLNPRYAGQRVWPSFSAAQNSSLAINTIDIYIDYACPFCAKIFKTLYEKVLPALKQGYPAQFILRQQIQPWHPGSLYMHEAAVAVLKIAPEKFLEFSKALFDHQRDFFDEVVATESRNQTYRRLAAIAAKAVDVDESSLLELIEVKEKPDEDGIIRNSGNQVTADIKVLVKTNRLVGVHVTPTVLLNGVVESAIESSFTGDQWLEWLNQKVAPISKA